MTRFFFRLWVLVSLGWITLWWWVDTVAGSGAGNPPLPWALYLVPPVLLYLAMMGLRWAFMGFREERRY